MNVNQIKEYILQHNKFLSLATTNGMTCWNAPLYFVRNSKDEFYFVSDNRSTHAKHIEENPYVVAAIFNSQASPAEVNGIQFDGLCKKVEINELPRAIKCIYREKDSSLLKERFIDFKNPNSYVNMTHFRIYKITPLHFYVLDPTNTKEDRRVEVRS